MKKPLGFRHIAINVEDAQKSKKFYTEVLGMELEWEPDPDNVYLTFGGQDNLAIHKRSEAPKSAQTLDHMGIVVKSIDEVDEWYQKLKAHQVTIAKEIKTHRDGARSFYFKDPDGIVIQLIYHPPISDQN